jgi:hypothetical protein
MSFSPFVQVRRPMYWIASPGNYKRQARVSLLLADEFDIAGG